MRPEKIEPNPRLVEIALDLLKLGVSNTRVTELLGYDPDVIERQLEWLPYRKAKRPEAFIIEAIRNDYSPPKEFFYAPPQTIASDPAAALDEDPEFALGSSFAEAQGHRTPGAPGAASTDVGMESAESFGDPLVQDVEGTDWPAE